MNENIFKNVTTSIEKIMGELANAKISSKNGLLRAAILKILDCSLSAIADCLVYQAEAENENVKENI